MKITLEHLGKTVTYLDRAPFLIEGFEREGENLFMFGTTEDGGGGGPLNPQHHDKRYYLINGAYDADTFESAEPESILPPSIEPLMEKFGCHEKQTRALVAAILKEIKEK